MRPFPAILLSLSLAVLAACDSAGGLRADRDSPYAPGVDSRDGSRAPGEI